MKESQNIEWKESWRDEYIKWICGFANASGGRIFIGIDDKGVVKGIYNAHKLLEELPNKVKSILGILVDVNLLSENSKDYLEIKVDPYPYPISYKGQYHYRSGSTKQELKGMALDRFLLQKQGKRWDGLPVPNLSVDELSDTAFEYFRRKAGQTQRLSTEDLKESNSMLLEKLHLFDNEYLKRATVLLFYSNSEKFVTGAYVKIGFFANDEDLQYQDEVHGTLFDQIEKTMDLLLTKYLKANIQYEGLNRTETYPIPESALREALLNAIAHKDYSSGTPIQISVYLNKIIFWNDGQLPDNWTVDHLKEKHPSKPYNPDVANVLFRAGLIESWGRGIIRIYEDCKKLGLTEPKFKYELSGFIVEINTSTSKTSVKTSEKASVKTSVKILDQMKNDKNITISELAKVLNKTERAIEMSIANLKKENKIERIGADKGGYWEIKSTES